jgi:hypothetical protein
MLLTAHCSLLTLISTPPVPDRRAQGEPLRSLVLFLCTIRFHKELAGELIRLVMF